MAGEHRTTINAVDTVQTELTERIRSFDFVAAVRLLENAQRDKPRVGEAVRIRDDALRLSQHVGLGFSGAALHSLSTTTGSHEHRLHVNFMGLLGSNGPLPLHFTEYADQRARNHADPTFREFLDLFNHRMLSLFYRASVQFDPAISFDRPGNNTYDEVLGALCGLLPEASTDRDSIDDSTKRHYPAWFGARAKSRDGLHSLLQDYFALPVSVREWVGSWLPLPDTSLASLGQGTESVQLGRSLYIGRRVWSIRHKFQVRLGPLDWETFSTFKPGGARARSLYDLVRNYAGDEWDWDLELILADEQVRPLRLDRRSCLGFDSWVQSSDGENNGNRIRDRARSRSVFLNQKLISQHREQTGTSP